MFSSTRQQEAEGGNPREKGNARSEPQFALAFSPGSHQTPKHTALASTTCRRRWRRLGQGRSWNSWRQALGRRGWQRPAWALPWSWAEGWTAQQHRAGSQRSCRGEIHGVPMSLRAGGRWILSKERAPE